MPSFWEKVSVNGIEMDVYVSVPDGSGPFPAVVVAQHASGVDKFIQDMADKLSAAGYAAVAPDLFHRITDKMVESTGKTKRDQLAAVLYHMVESCAHISVLLSPVTPEACAKIQNQLRLPELAEKTIPELAWGLIPAGHEIGKPKPVFPRIQIPTED